MSRGSTLSTEECFSALALGYILQNEHGFTVRLARGKQVISNSNRKSRRRGKYAYKFDYPTWKIVGKIPLWESVVNKAYILWQGNKGLKW